MINQKPMMWSVINKHHPHAKGLTAAYLFNDYGCKTAHDYYNENDILLTNTSWGDSGLIADANGEYGLIVNTDDRVINANAGTIIICAKNYTTFGDGVGRRLFGNAIAGGVYLAKQPAPENFLNFWLRRPSGYKYIVTLNNVPTWNDDTVYVVSWDRLNQIYDSKHIAIGLNGVYLVPDSSTNVSAGWSSFNVLDNLAVLSDYSNFNYPWTGVGKYMFIFNYALPEFLIKDIYENPYDMIIQ